MATSSLGGSIIDFCHESIRENAKEMENSQDEKICKRIWKNAYESRMLEIGPLVQLAIVYKYITRKTPDKMFQLNKTLSSSKYKASNLKKEFLALSGSSSICSYFSRLDMEGVLCLLGTLLSEPNYFFTKTVLMDFLGKLNGISEPRGITEKVFQMELSDSESEGHDMSSGWTEEALSLYHTLNKVARGKCNDPDAHSCLNDIVSVNKQFKEYMLMVGDNEAMNKETIILGWMDSVLRIFGDNRFLKVTGVQYHVLKNISDRLSSLRSSV